MHIWHKIYGPDSQKKQQKKEAGREKMPKMKRLRKAQLRFWVTEREAELIRLKMAELGTNNLSAYLRKIAIDGLIVKLDLPELREMISLLRRSGNNINQMAKRMNETGRLYGVDFEDVLENQEQLWEMANGILSKLAEIR